MNVELKPRIAKLLEAQVASGRFTTVEAAIEALALNDAASCSDIDATDLGWARPYMAKGLEDRAAGRTFPAEDVHAELRARFRVNKE